MFRYYLDHHQGAMFSLLKLYYNIHSLINFCKCECYNTNLARKTQLPDDDLKRSKHVGVILSVFNYFYLGFV